MKKYIKSYFELFPIIYLGVSLAYAITGMIAGRDHVLSYASFFYPMAIAAACTVPILIVREPENASAKQLLYRRILRLILIEGIVLSTVHNAAPEDSPMSTQELFLVGIFVMLGYLLVRFVLWLTAYLDAEELNRKLKALKKNDDDSL